MDVIRTIWLRCLPALLAVVLCLLTQPGSVGAEVQGKAAIAALAYDKAGGRLFKLQGQLLFESKDSGQSWTGIPLPEKADDTLAIGVAADGSNLYVAQPGSGLFRKEIGSGNWAAVDEGLPSNDVRAFTTHATQPATIYVLIARHGIYRSQNAGKDWRKMDRGPEEAQQMIHTNMAGSMDSGWLYVLTAKGVRLSMDCFCLWRDIGDANEQIRALAFDREQPDHVFAASTRGVLRSLNGGQDWELAGTPGPLITAIIVAASGVIYAGAKDGKLYRSRDGAKTWEPAGE
jgi:photosystem II stability/assembly factor-like uncharacterized protein